mgnify:CR=1 FL=1
MFNNTQKTEFKASLLIRISTILVSIIVFNRWINLRFMVGPFRFTHLLAWIGGAYVGLFTPVYYILKRRKPHIVKPLLRFHTYGNLISFMLYSVHNTQQLSRPKEFYPDLGTGISLYIIMLVLVFTGFIYRFNLLQSYTRFAKDTPHFNRNLHVILTLSIYLILIVHILTNIG